MRTLGAAACLATLVITAGAQRESIMDVHMPAFAADAQGRPPLALGASFTSCAIRSMTSSVFEMPPVQNAFQIWSIGFLMSPVSIHLSEFEPAHLARRGARSSGRAVRRAHSACRGLLPGPRSPDRLAAAARDRDPGGCWMCGESSEFPGVPIWVMIVP
jgi:hypothetical protein